MVSFQVSLAHARFTSDFLLARQGARVLTIINKGRSKIENIFFSIFSPPPPLYTRFTTGILRNYNAFADMIENELFLAKTSFHSEPIPPINGTTSYNGR